MSATQSPPVTMITIPAETTTTEPPTTTEAPATTEAPPAPSTTPTTTETATTVAPMEPVVEPAADASGLGGWILVLVVAALLAAFALARRRRTRDQPAVIIPPGPSLTERVRAAVERAEHEDPAEHVDFPNVSVADLYPWIEPPDDITLVVDLRTAEALQEVGVTSLDQLADMNDQIVRSMVEAGIDIDTRAVEAAAQDILGRRTEDGPA